MSQRLEQAKQEVQKVNELPQPTMDIADIRKNHHKMTDERDLESDNEEIADQMGTNVLGASAPAFLLEADDPLADGSFNFA